jgi:hypothetical protein
MQRQTLDAAIKMLCFVKLQLFGRVSGDICGHLPICECCFRPYYCRTICGLDSYLNPSERMVMLEAFAIHFKRILYFCDVEFTIDVSLHSGMSEAYGCY